MPGEDVNSTLQFGADITDFSAAMQEASRLASRAKSEFDVVASTMDDWSSSTEGLTAKLEQLDAQQQVEERRLAILRAAYEKTVKEQGENSKAAIELETKLNKQQATVNKTAKQHDKFAEKLEEVEKGAEDAADEVKKAGNAAKKSGEDAEDGGDGWTIFKDVVADFVSNTISSLVDSIAGAAEATREYRRDMAQMAQNAEDAGVDMAVMKNTLEDVASVTGEADAAMEGLNMLMASGLKTDEIEFAAQALAGAATKFDGVKFEGIAEGLQETLATGAAVGPFSEIIERTGGNLETFNAGLAACTTEAERQQYVLQWLADSGLAGVHDAYVQNNADLVAAEQAQFRLNDAMAAVGTATEPIQTALSNLGATILEKIAPAITNIVQWVTDNLPIVAPIVAGIAAAFAVLATALAISGIISGVTKAFALLNATLLANPIVLIVAAIAALVAAFITLWNNSEEFRNFWINLWDGIKKTVSSVADWFKKTAKNIAEFFSNAWKTIKEVWSNSTIGKYFKQVWETIKGIFSVVKEVFSGNFSGAWEAVKKIFAGWGAFFSDLWSKVTGVFSKVGSWFGDIFRSAWQGIKDAFANVGSFFSDVWQKIKSAFSFSNMIDIGRNLVEGLWNGLTNSLQWIKDKITGWVGSVLDFMKGLFGIHSPSDETEWQGEMLVEGYVRALQNGRQRMANAMRGLARSGLDAMGEVSTPDVGGAAGMTGKTINFTQNNYSPKELSRREIFRQTHNALAHVGGM